jgi:two-component system CheB/CheR fusion protein
LNIVWKLDHDLQLTWSETRRDALSEDGDVGSGFGTLLVQTSSRQLGGHVERDISDDMFTISLTLPDKVLADA